MSDALRPPTYFPLITMQERDDLGGRDPLEAYADEIATRRAGGIRTMGGALAGSLIASALDKGVTVLRGSGVTALDRSGNVGRMWTVTVEGGDTVTAQSVVIASGGFEWNEQLRGSLLRFDVRPISAPSNEGDGFYLGMQAGADVSDSGEIWGVPVICPPDQVYDGKPGGRMGNVEMTLPGSVTVNSDGRRFVNEALNYHDLSRIFVNVDPATGRPANTPTWLIMDSTYVNRYQVAGTGPGNPPEWVTCADSVDELARAIDVDAEGLTETIRRFNADAAEGVDREFGRGNSPEDRHLGDPRVEPNPVLAPLEAGPFYAVPVYPGVLGTSGGLRVDLSGHVVARDGQPIPGLFAAGNCSATVFHGAYPGGGATLGSAVTRGFAVGEKLAGLDRSD